jgi:outer membrane lipoprotein-sorting protein
MYVDKETWLQVGSVLKGEEGQLIGEYFFRDVKLNPRFKPGTFTRDALKR